MDWDDFLRFDWILNEWMIIPFVLVALAVYLLLREWLFRVVDSVVRAVCLVGRFFARLWRWYIGYLTRMADDSFLSVCATGHFFARIWRWCVGNPVTLFRWAVVVLLGGIFWCLCPKCKHEGKKPGVRLYSSGMQNIRIE